MTEVDTQSSITIVSKSDKCSFKFSQKAIDASELLKNICDLTTITEPIEVDCPSKSLQLFLQLCNHYESVGDEHDYEFEKALYNSFNDVELAEIILDLSVLDSDFFLDSMADFILCKMVKFNWQEMAEYLGIETDFTSDERILKSKFSFEFVLSMDVEALKFPFLNKNLCNINVKLFSSPMNALLARIIERSDAKASFQLSLICKAIKNEVDRYPLKFDKFIIRPTGIFKLGSEVFHLDMPDNERYQNAIKKRGMIVQECDAKFDESSEKARLCSFLMKHIISITNYEMLVYFRSESRYNVIYDFDITHCPFYSIFYKFNGDRFFGKSFKPFYDHLIAKDFSKEIKIKFFGFFKYIAHGNCFKHANAKKFHHVQILTGLSFNNKKEICQLKEIIMNYTEDDGIVSTRKLIPGLQEEKTKEGLKYKVSDIKPLL